METEWMERGHNFVGRKEEKRKFLELVELYQLPERPSERGVLVVHGHGGYGKSWLIKEFASICHNTNVPCLYANARESRIASLSSLIDALVLSIPSDEKVVKAFRDYFKLRESYKEPHPSDNSTEEERGGSPSVSDAIGSSFTANYGGTEHSYPQSEQGMPLISRVLRRQKKTTVQDLTDGFAAALSKTFQNQLLVVFIDGYEHICKITGFNEQVQEGLLTRLYPPVFLVLAGRTDLIGSGLVSPRLCSNPQPMKLGRLSAAEGRQYILQSHEVKSEELVELILRKSLRVPQGLWLLTSRLNLYSTEEQAIKAFSRLGASDDWGVVVEGLTREWLEDLPAGEKVSTQAAAVLHEFDADILGHVLNEDVSKIVLPRASMRTTSARRGSLLHDEMRQCIREYVRLQHHKLFERWNERAASFYYEQLVESELNKTQARFADAEWSYNAEEYVYHLAQWDLENGISTFMDLVADAFWYNHHSTALNLVGALEELEHLGINSFLAALRLAIELVSRDKSSDAVASLDVLLDLDPPAGKERLKEFAHDALGDCYRALKKWDKAQQHLQKAIKYFEGRNELFKLATAQQQIADCAKAQNDTKESEKWLQLAIENYRRVSETTADEKTRAVIGEARCLQQMGKAEEAESAFKQLLGEHPSDWLVMANWALALENWSRWQEAIEAHKNVAELSEAHRAGAWERVGDLYRDHLKDLAQAVVAYKTSLQAEPSRQSVWAALATAYETFEEWLEAAEVHEQIAENIPEWRLVALVKAAQCLGKAGQAEEAEERFQALLAEAPQDTQVLGYWGWFLEQQERWQEAIEAHKNVAELSDSNRAGAWERIGDLYRDHLKDLAQAVAAYKTSLEVEPNRQSALAALATAYETFEEWLEAAGVHDQIAENIPEWRLVALVKEAQCLGKAGQVEEAEERFQALLEEAPQDGEALAGWAFFLDESKRWLEAAEAYERFAEVVPDGRLVALARAAQCLGKAGQVEEAGERFQALLEEAPQDGEVLAGWAFFLEQQERWQEAVGVHQHVAEVSGVHRAGAWERIGDLYRDHLKDLAQAVAAYETSLEVEPNRRSALGGMIRLYEAFAEWVGAAEAYERFAEVVPDQRLVALAKAAECLGKAGQAEEAEERFQALLAEAPQDGETLAGWVFFLEQQERWQEAAEAYERFAEVVPDQRLVALARAAQCLGKAGQVEEAEERFQALLEEAPQDGGVLAVWAQFLEQQERWQEAVGVHQHVAEVSGVHRAGAWERVGDLYRDHLKDLAQAVAAYETSLEVEPNRQSALAALATAYETFEEWLEGAGVHDQIAENIPEWRLVALVKAAQCLGKAGQVEEAEERFQALLEEAPQDGEVLAGWAVFLEQQERWQEATEAYERVAEVVPDRRLVTLVKAAQCLGKAGQVEEAEERFQALLEEAPQDGEVLAGWAFFLEQQERWQEAVIVYKQACAVSESLCVDVQLQAASIMLEHLDQPETSLEMLLELESEVPERVDVLMQTARGFEAAGDFVAAARRYKQIEELLGGSGGSFTDQRRLGWTWFKQKKFDAAVSVLGKMDRNAKAADRKRALIIRASIAVLSGDSRSMDGLLDTLGSMGRLETVYVWEAVFDIGKVAMQMESPGDVKGFIEKIRFLGQLP